MDGVGREDYTVLMFSLFTSEFIAAVNDFRAQLRRALAVETSPRRRRLNVRVYSA